MAFKSPIHDLHVQAGALFTDYGVSEPQGQLGSAGSGVIPVVASYGELALEYASLRRACVILDLPQRGLVEVRGPDAQSFLNRMLTQELKDLKAGELRHSFWLNRKGRIDADLNVMRQGERFLLELDAMAVPRTVTELTRYLVMEEATIRDLSMEQHRLSLHGPTVPLLIQTVTGGDMLAPREVRSLRIGDETAIAFRDDTCAVPGVELIMDVRAVAAVFRALVQAGHDSHHGAEALRETGNAAPGAKIRLRPAGWHAYNIARIEGGTPMYNLDFGPDSLPAQSGVLNDRVSFTKGCYLGQEVVARMHSRGHSKSMLMAVQLKESGLDRNLPMTGAAVRLPGQEEVIGSVTTFTYSPTMSAARIGFAMMKQDHAKADLEITIDTGDVREPAKTCAALAFMKPAS